MTKGLTKCVLIVSLITLLITSGFPFLPSEVQMIGNASSESITSWVETDWSNYGYSSDKSNVDCTSTPGDLKLEKETVVYVADTYNHRIVKTTMDGTTWTSYGSKGSGNDQFNYPTSIFYDSTTDFIYIADSANHRIVKTKIDGSGWTILGSFGSGTGQFKAPTGIWYDISTEYIYVTDYSNYRIVKTKFDGSGWTTLGTYGYGTKQFADPRDLCYDDNSGYVFVADGSSGRIIKTKIDGTGWYEQEHPFVDEYLAPCGITYDHQTGYIYITDFGVSTTTYLYRTKMDGNIEYFGVVGLANPYGIQVDSETGYLYIADAGWNFIVRTTWRHGMKTFGSYGTGKYNFNQPHDVTIGEKQFQESGYLISRSHYCEGASSFNKISWNAETTDNTEIKFQLRTARKEPGLNSAKFVGPDGTSSTFYTSSPSNIWAGHNREKWIQYKISLSTAVDDESPVLKDVTITYETGSGGGGKPSKPPDKPSKPHGPKK